MGVSGPSLHIVSTDSMIVLTSVSPDEACNHADSITVMIIGTSDLNFILMLTLELDY